MQPIRRLTVGTVRLLQFIFLLLSCHVSNAQTFNGTGGAIPDGGPQACFPVNVTGIGNINGTYGLSSVCLNITHAWVGDLQIYLQSPTGIIIPLSLQSGGGGTNYTNTCFTGTAATSISAGVAPFTGNFLPVEPLGTFNNGQNANGIWQLCIADITSPDAGNLVDWTLLFNNSPAPPPVLPANDDPCNAIALTVGSSCVFNTYTNENATGSVGLPPPGCASYTGGDVWFQALVPPGGAVTIDTEEGVLFDAAMAIYTGACNSLTLLACDDDGSSNGFMPLIAASGLTPGSTIWIRIWNIFTDNKGSFGICVSIPPPPPANDNPCNAIPLTVTNSCVFATHTNAGATGTTGVPAPPCGFYLGADVWFTAIVPSGGAIFFDTNSGSMADVDIAVYSGACGALTFIRCDDVSSSNPMMGSITLGGLTPGTILWIRVWGFGLDNTGTFGICASLPPPPTVQDCPAAIPICQNVYSESVSYSGTGNIPVEINSTISCLGSGEKNDVWYTFTVQTSGNLNFTITPNVFSEDYDWAVYNLTSATCADIFTNDAINVSCNFSVTGGTTGPDGGTTLTDQDASGVPFNAVIPVLAGETYVINVSNFSASANGYTIDFGASTASIFDNVPPVLQSVNAASTCGGNNLSVNFSENILCSTIQNTDFVVNGPGGPYTVTGWSSTSCSSGATYGNNITLTLSPAIATNGAFQVCLTNVSGSVTDLCGNVALPACLNFNIVTVVPTFSTIPSICSGSTAPVLPATSNNGISGTWSPAVVSNTATGVYTFTPGVGQCATQATLTVTVTPIGTTPTFTPIQPICAGAAAPVLPVTSTNGITGTWSPATVNNTTTGTYTFTPTAGQCATSTSITITVNSPVVPNFATLPPICTGAVAPILPLISINGITGTWTPAIVSTTVTTIYTFTPAAGQCASSTTLTVTVTNVLNSTTNITICNDQMPYSWNGQIYGAAGTYTVTLTSSAGCDSIALLILAVNAVLTSTTNTTICNNQFPYTWNGQSYGSAGTYSVTLTGTAGCDSVATLNLMVNPVLTSTTNLSICNNQLPYVWNGQSYSAAGINSVTLISTAGCDSIATLNLAVSSVTQSITNTTICANQLPYTWNGQSYAGAGNYVVTLTGASGCDSVATLNLTINPLSGSTTTVTICTTQLPYTWNAQSFTAAGTYPITFVGSLGCDSIAILQLIVNTSLSSTTNASICNDQLPYSWNGQNYSASGIYSITLTSSSGCDSIATLALSVNTIVQSTTNTSVCSSQLPYSWNGQNYSAGGTYIVTLTSSAGCDSIATLNLSVNNVLAGSTGITICSNQLPYSWNGQVYNGGGIYQAVLAGSNGCDSVVTLTLVVNPVSASITNTNICNNQLPYNWNGQTYFNAGTYSVTLTGSTGCDSVATLILVVNTVTTSTANITRCSLQLPYTWNGQQYSAAGIYTLTLTGSNNCDSIATLNLSVNPSPAMPGVAPVSYCQFQPASSLTANGQGNLLWYTTPIGGTGSSTAPVPSTTNAGVLTYYVSQVVGGCESPRASVTVSINPAPQLGVDKDLRICFGNSADLTTIFNLASLTSSWSFGNNPIVNPTSVTAPGIYQLIAANPFGCADTVNVHLIVQPQVNAFAGDDMNAEYNFPIQLSGSGGQQYQWSPGIPLLNNPQLSNPVATLLTDQTFTLLVKDAYGCEGRDTVNIRVLNGPAIYVPSAFTPNADGLNDIFLPVSVGVLELNYFRVYNRWSELVFESNNSSKGWDGTHKGMTQNTGSFVWVLQAKDRKGKTWNMKGNVLLIR